MLTKIKIIGVLICAGVLLSACGDNTSKAEAYVKEKYPNAKILSFNEIQKEFGVKNKECLIDDKSGFFIKTYVFFKVDDEFKISRIETRPDNGASAITATYSNVKDNDEFEHFKRHNMNAECF